MATDLYHRMLAFDYGDTERADLMKQVWQDTPWMIDVWSGGYSRHRDREMEILNWCNDTFGQQAAPIHERPGAWYRGSATIHGWTWFGFSTEADMVRFQERWPTPEGVREPVATTALADAESFA